MPSQNFSPTPPTEDGYVLLSTTDCEGIPIDPFTWQDFSTTNFIRCDAEPSGPATHMRRGYLFFDTSALPGGITVTKVEIYLYCFMNSATGNVLLVQQATQKSGYATEEALYNGLDDGATYSSVLPVTGAGATYDLGATAVTDITSHATWFGVGVIASNEAIASNLSFLSQESVDDVGAPFERPYLVVTYVNSLLPRLPLLGVG